jgi:hypothetical protein
VGNSLPSTFHSYPNATISSLSTDPAASASSIPDTTNTDTSFLSFGTSSPNDGDYSPPTTDDWLAAMGTSDPEYNDITEALATTEYDEVPSSSAPASTTPAGASFAANPAQAAYAINTISDPSGDATVPSYRVAQQGNRKRSFGADALPQRAFLITSSLQRHRFAARHNRAHARRNIGAVKVERDDSPTDTPEQGAISKGYADGWKAAKTFAAFGGSRLGEWYLSSLSCPCTKHRAGFTGQFVSDALSAMGGQIISSDQQYYRTWFSKSRCSYL